MVDKSVPSKIQNIFSHIDEIKDFKNPEVCRHVVGLLKDCKDYKDVQTVISQLILLCHPLPQSIEKKMTDLTNDTDMLTKVKSAMVDFQHCLRESRDTLPIVRTMLKTSMQMKLVEQNK
jgi:hypothetical protein